jgi:hypothetical protein
MKRRSLEQLRHAALRCMMVKTRAWELGRILGEIETRFGRDGWVPITRAHCARSWFGPKYFSQHVLVSSEFGREDVDRWGVHKCVIVYRAGKFGRREVALESMRAGMTVRDLEAIALGCLREERSRAA